MHPAEVLIQLHQASKAGANNPFSFASVLNTLNF